MPNSIAEQFLPINSEYTSYLQEALDCLGVTHATASPYLILKMLHAILQHGIDINFLPLQSQPETNEIQRKWIRWGNAVNLAIQEYETKTDPVEYQNDTYTYSLRSKNKAINLLFYHPSEIQDTSKSSNALGLKLVFLARLMISGYEKNQKDKAKINQLFNLFINKLRFFPELNLDFSSNISFEKIIHICETLVETKYTDPVKSDRKFLDSLKNSLRLLQGYQLGIPRKQSKPSTKAKKSSARPSGKRIAQTIRHTPFYDPTDSIPNIGTFIEIVPEQGEEPIIGVITPETESDDDNEIPDELASAATQVKTKYWLQTYNEATPWNSRGINPFTRTLLIKWIKANDTTTSLIFGLMLCIGRRFEDTLALEIGEDADITPDGTFIRTYNPPDNCFSPSPDQQALVEPVNQTLRLTLPTIIRKRLIERYIQDTSRKTLGHVLDTDTEHLKIDTQKVIRRLIREGATGLALDRIHLSFEKQLSKITGDEVIGHMLAGRPDDMPPVSAYYSAYPHSNIETIYRQAVEELYQ